MQDFEKNWIFEHNWEIWFRFFWIIFCKISYGNDNFIYLIFNDFYFKLHKKYSKTNRESDKPVYFITADNTVCQTGYEYTVRSLITWKFCQSILYLLTDLNCMKILLKTLLNPLIALAVYTRSLTCCFPCRAFIV